MARITRFSAQQPVPVEQAQLIDPSGFRPSGVSAQVLGDIGNVLQELGERKQAAEDRIGISNVNAAMENAQREYEKDIIGRPTEEHAAILQKHKNAALAVIANQKLSPDTRVLADNKAQIWGDTFADLGEIATIKAIEDDALIRVTSDYEKALTEGTAGDIIEAEIPFNEQLKSSMEPAEAEKYKAQVEERAVKQMERNALESQMNKAAVNPEQATKDMDAELALRKKGKEPTAGLSFLSNTDLEAVRDYARSVGEKAKSDSEIAVNAAIEESYAKIIAGDKDITSMVGEILANPAISEEDAISAADKIPTFFNKWNSTKVADESDNGVYDELTQASEAVERGAMSPAAFEELYADKKEFLDRDDQRTIRSKDIVATRTMQNRTFNDAMITERATFIEATEDTIGAIKLARQNAELIKDIPSLNLFNIALKKNQAEQWNFGRFRKQLRSQINQNPEWSTKQINTARDVLVDQLDVSDDELLRAFDSQNPNRAITKTSPDGAFDDIWQDLSFEDKSLIWSERMAGTPVSALLESEQVTEAKKGKK